MTALQEAIEHFKISNSQPSYSRKQIIYILEQFILKEYGQIANAYSDGAEAQRDSKYFGME